MAIDKLLVLSSNEFFNLLNVFDGNLVAWIRQRGVSVLFLAKLADLLLLTWKVDDLIENNTGGFRNVIHQ